MSFEFETNLSRVAFSPLSCPFDSFNLQFKQTSFNLCFNFDSLLFVVHRSSIISVVSDERCATTLISEVQVVPSSPLSHHARNSNNSNNSRRQS